MLTVVAVDDSRAAGRVATLVSDASRGRKVLGQVVRDVRAGQIEDRVDVLRSSGSGQDLQRGGGTWLDLRLALVECIARLRPSQICRAHVFSVTGRAAAS